jgi:secondary thiamine-phosphate synthase enzyme
MEIRTGFIEIETRGHSDIIDVTPQVRDLLIESGLKEGQVTVFASGSTAGVTTIEYEPGLLKDIPDALDRIAPEDAPYHHDAAWGDGNGNAHVRAALIGASFTAPFISGQLLLGTWQQIVVIDCDTRPRSRRIAVQIMGKS